MNKILEAIKRLNKKWTIIILIGVLLLSLLIGLSTKSNPKIEKAAHEVVQIAEEVRQFYRSRPGYWGLNTAAVIKNGIAPNSTLKQDQLLNSLDKEIAIGQGIDGNLVMPGTKSFDIAYKNLSKSECIDLATYPFTEQQSLGLLAIAIYNQESNAEFNWGGENRLPIQKSAAKKQCQDNSSIIWTFE